MFGILNFISEIFNIYCFFAQNTIVRQDKNIFGGVKLWKTIKIRTTIKTTIRIIIRTTIRTKIIRITRTKTKQNSNSKNVQKMQGTYYLAFFVLKFKVLSSCIKTGSIPSFLNILQKTHLGLFAFCLAVLMEAISKILMVEQILSIDLYLVSSI